MCLLTRLVVDYADTVSALLLTTRTHADTDVKEIIRGKSTLVCLLTRVVVNYADTVSVLLLTTRTQVFRTVYLRINKIFRETYF